MSAYFCAQSLHGGEMVPATFVIRAIERIPDSPRTADTEYRAIPGSYHASTMFATCRDHLALATSGMVARYGQVVVYRPPSEP